MGHPRREDEWASYEGEGPPVSGRPIQEGRKTKRCGARAKEALKVKMKTKESCMGARGRVGPH